MKLIMEVLYLLLSDPILSVLEARMLVRCQPAAFIDRSHRAIKSFNPCFISLGIGPFLEVRD